jgi:hypothetical protein
LRSPLRFFLARQDSLQYIARLGDVGEINLGTILLLIANACRWCRAGSALKMRTDLFGFTRLDGTRVGFAICHIHVFQGIENLLTLDFQLARQIVNSNLTHPPLFVVVLISRLTGHSNLAANRAVPIAIIL